MVEDSLFFDLSRNGLDEVKPVSLVTSPLEEEVAGQNGNLDLGSRTSVLGMDPDDERNYNEMVPFYYSWGSLPIDRLVELIEKNEDKLDPHSMLVEGVEELEEHMLRIYQTAYAHYALGLKSNIKGTFPDECCGISANNLAVSLMDHGYTNAVYIHNGLYDHCYVVVPFVMKDGSFKGSIIVDPTSDQLWSKLNKQPKNAVFVVPEKGWEYRTNWRSGSDLVPQDVVSLGLINEYIKGKKTGTVFSTDVAKSYLAPNAREYFEAAFANPMRLDAA
jgi:hypothetical protein